MDIYCMQGRCVVTVDQRGWEIIKKVLVFVDIEAIIILFYNNFNYFGEVMPM